MKKTEDKQGSSRRRADFVFALRLLRRNPLVMAGLVISVGTILIALFSHEIVNATYWHHQNLYLRLCWNNPSFSWPISNVFICSGSVYPLGTDSYGRGLLQMIVLAIPIDLQIELIVVDSAVVIGVTLGSLAAYMGGVLDEIIVRISGLFLAVR